MAMQYASFNAAEAALATAGLKDWLSLAAPALAAVSRSGSLDSGRPALVAAEETYSVVRLVSSLL